MFRALGFVSLIVVLAIGSYVYMRQAQSASPNPAGNPRATADLIGVKTDLLAIAQAERSHNATHGTYASLDELRSQGELTMTRASRGPYTYSADVSENAFRIVATYSGSDPQMPRTLSVDESMQVSQAESP